jgi:hypothetical protein
LTIRRALNRGLGIAAALALIGCSLLHSGSSGSASPAAQASETTPQSEGTPSEAAPDQGNTSGPGATVSISYSHPGDYLASLSVSEFNGAEMLESRNVDQTHTESVVRFDGGIPVWEIKASNGVLSKLPGLGSHAEYALKSVRYGNLPKNFSQVLPDTGPPEPLETGHYYVFVAQRASGAVSYEAIRVEPDGTLDGYEAQPRAGTSYALCCDVSPDFAQPLPSNIGP